MPLRGLFYAILIWMGISLLLSIIIGKYLHWRDKHHEGKG